MDRDNRGEVRPPVDQGVGKSGSILTQSVKYVVVYEQGPRNWSAYVPDLPGCVATAATREAVGELIREGIELHVEGLREDDEPVPVPGWWAEEVEVNTPERQPAHPE